MQNLSREKATPAGQRGGVTPCIICGRQARYERPTRGDHLCDSCRKVTTYHFGGKDNSQLNESMMRATVRIRRIAYAIGFVRLVHQAITRFSPCSPAHFATCVSQ